MNFESLLPQWPKEVWKSNPTIRAEAATEVGRVREERARRKKIREEKGRKKIQVRERYKVACAFKRSKSRWVRSHLGR